MVDDEPLALERLSDLLAQIDGVVLIGSVASGVDAIAAISLERPDLVLLDIEMPRIDGFDVVEAVSRKSSMQDGTAPLICFVTAYPQFALDAFATGALDFLCKPVRFKRLERAISRARVAVEQREAARRLSELSSHLDSLRDARLPTEERCIWVRQRGALVRIDIAALDWIEAEGEYVRLYVGDTSHLVRSSISSLTEQLEDEGFVRVHRSVTINRRRLRSIRRRRGAMSVVLSSDVELPVGRKYHHVVQAIIA